MAKVRAAKTAQSELDAYAAELNDDGVSVKSMMDATGERGTAFHVSHSSFHRWAQRARERDQSSQDETENP